MKRLIGFCCLLVIFAFPASAQIASNIDVSAGYSLRVFQTGSVRLGMNGWYGAADYKILKWLAADAEVSGNYRNNGVNGDNSIYTAMAGPQFRLLNHGRVNMFAHGLAGQGLFRTAFPAFGGFPSEVATTWRWAWEAGGGIDYSRWSRWKVRVLEVDFGQTHFFDKSQSNYRASIGFVYTFGQK